MAHNINHRDYSSLRRIGLSKTAVAAYQSLANDGSAKVSELAKRLNVPRTGLYRVLDSMEEQGFVVGLKIQYLPATYVARPIHQAVELHVKYIRRIMSPLLGGYEEFAKKYNKGER